MKVAVAQITTDPGFIQPNLEKIKRYIDLSNDQCADIVVFPELTIPGYIPLDFVLNDTFVDENIAALKSVIDYTEGKNIVVVCGFIDIAPRMRPDGLRGRYNSLAIIKDGHLIAKRHKTLFPDYDIFFEKRYFDQRTDAQNFKPLNGYVDLNSNGIANENIGFLVCEDIWDDNYDIHPIEELMSQARGDLDLLVTSNASPFVAGKTATRAKVLGKVFTRCQCPIVYVNRVGAIDGYEGQVVFDGNSLILDRDGRVVHKCKAFEEDFFVFDTKNKYEEIKIEASNKTQEIHDALIVGIKDYCRMSGFKQAVIGLSGGIDSAVVAALAVEALGKENVLGITMPSHITSDETKNDAIALANNLGIAINTAPIGFTFDQVVGSLQGGKALDSNVKDLTFQNIQARIRGTFLMAVSNETGRILLTTGNKTETALGYCTLYGDMAGGLAVISDVSKLQVYEIAKYINIKFGKAVIPETTITRPPTAELTGGQTDENSLGVQYSVLSPLVDELVEEGKTFDELCGKYEPETIKKIIRLINTAEYKRRQAAPGIKVTGKAFGVGRRIPMMHGFGG